MAIWIGDYLHNREPLNADGLVLFWNDAGDRVLCCQVIEEPGTRPRELGQMTRYTGALPPEHPDDIATDARIMAEMADTATR